jgi:hypothetical protein
MTLLQAILWAALCFVLLYGFYALIAWFAGGIRSNQG